MLRELLKIIKLLEEINEKLDANNGKVNTGIKVNVVRATRAKMRGVR